MTGISRGRWYRASWLCLAAAACGGRAGSRAKGAEPAIRVIPLARAIVLETPGPRALGPRQRRALRAGARGGPGDPERPAAHAAALAPSRGGQPEGTDARARHLPGGRSPMTATFDAFAARARQGGAMVPVTRQ